MNKIIYFTGSLEAGGLESFVSRVSIRGKQEKRFQPVIVCLSQRVGVFLKEVEKEGILVLEAPKGWQRNPFALFRLGKLIGNKQPSVVHSQVNFSLFQQWFATWFFTRAKFMVTERNCYPLLNFALLRRRFQFYFLKRLGVHYSGNSREVASHLALLMKYPISKIPVIPNGVKMPHTSLEVRNKVRNRYGWATEDFVVGYVARFAPQKGHNYFIKVMDQLWNVLGDRLKICFIGDGPLRKTIENQILNSNLSSLSLFTGVIENVDEYYQSFDCTALLSDYEGMPNVVVEAMAHSLPVVANPVGNVLELFEGEAGMVNCFSTPEQTANLFLSLAQQPHLRQRIGEFANAKIARKFSLDNTMRLLTKYYDIS